MELVADKYKQTDIGIIPSDWDIDYIKNLAVIKTGGRNTQDRIENGLYPFFVRSQTVERINSYSFDGEAVLTAGDGVGVGKVIHYVNEKFDCHQRVYRISDFSEKLNGYFFYLYFSNNFLNRIMQMTAKSSVDSVRMDMIANMQIPLPPTKAEQTAIATALSDADALISGLEKLIAKKRNIKQGAMQKLLQPKEGWEVKKLGDLITYKNGKSFESFIEENGEYYLITLNSINIKGELKKDHLRVKEFDNSLEKGDLIMVLSDVAHGNFLGLTDVIPENNKYVLNQRMGALKNLKGVTPRFLSIYINHYQSYFKLSGKGSSQQNLGKDDILKFEIHLPSAEEQTQIATILSDMDAEITALETKLEKYRKVKLGMMQNLLTGKIRLL